MENRKIKKWHIVVIALAVIAIPILINICIQIPAFFPFVGTAENWLMFWATYLGVIASAAMVCITYFTLVQNGEQVAEMKRQRDEDRQKELVAYLTVHESYFYLCVRNISIVPIRDIHASITHIPSGVHSPGIEFVNYFNGATFSIEPGGCRYINTQVVKSCPAGYKPKVDNADADDYLGLEFTFDDNPSYAVNLPFREGSIIADNLEQRKQQ